MLWDVDYTLVATGRAGWHLYELVLAELYGLAMPGGLGGMGGRTDTSIALEVLAAAGVTNPLTDLPKFQQRMAARAPELESMVREYGRILPGAAEALAAVSSLAEQDDGQLVVQSLLTGNIPALAEVKLGALGLTGHLDLSIGAYGDVSEVRADLVPVARQNAARRYDADFSGTATVLVGDTPKDVEAAADSGARAVAVASGNFTMRQLRDAGAEVVLPDLTDTAAVVGAVCSVEAAG